MSPGERKQRFTELRRRRILERLAAIKEVCGKAKLICGLPTPRYVEQGCCKDDLHIDNLKEDKSGRYMRPVRPTVRPAG